MLDVIGNSETFNGNDIIAIRMKDGESFLDSLKEVFERYYVNSGIILGAVGMLKDVTLGYFNGKAYLKTEIKEPCELVSSQGNVAHDEKGELIVHVHVSLARESKEMIGGHLVQGKVSNTVEMFVLKLSDVDLLKKPQETDIPQLFPGLRR
ncbi:MAG: DUF296 domain-containing protein [Thermotoga sp.]|nr:DUF296 domain-containing protein [Thermotogota bacterium]RKX55754.1 MAG: DUF296 domain-containing protein [Thermotoga sp.]